MCQILIVCVRAKSLQSCLTYCKPMQSCSGLLFPPPGELSEPGMEPASLMFPALAGGFFTTSAIWEEQFSSKGNTGTEKERERCPTLRNLGRYLCYVCDRGGGR